MNTLTTRPMKLFALTLSIGISASLIDALSAGFTPVQASTDGTVQCVLELPTVTVHGKRLTQADAVVANVTPQVTASTEPAKL